MTAQQAAQQIQAIPSAQFYADQENTLTLSMENVMLRKQLRESEEENTMIRRLDSGLRCSLDSRTNCTGCPECRV